MSTEARPPPCPGRLADTTWGENRVTRPAANTLSWSTGRSGASPPGPAVAPPTSDPVALRTSTAAPAAGAPDDSTTVTRRSQATSTCAEAVTLGPENEVLST